MGPPARPAEPRVQLSVRVTPLQSSGPVVEVEVEMNTRSSRWLWADPSTPLWSILDLRDDAGQIPYAIDSDGGHVLSLERPPKGRVYLRYRLEMPPPEERSAPDPRLWLDPTENVMHATGESLLWLPEGQTPITCRLEINAPDTPVATGFGLDRVIEVEVSPDALRRTNVLVGPLGTARFRLPFAEDDAAALGVTPYDMRWVAAETAGVRTSIGEYFGAFDEGRFTTLLVSGLRRPNSALHAVDLRTRSLVVDGSSWAAWGGGARLSVASALAHRWLGGRVRVDMGGARGEGVWFTQGFSRHVARDVLFTIGLLTDEDMIAELDGLESVLATSPLARSSNADAVAAGTPDAVRLVTARGALYAARLKSQIKKHSGIENSLDGLLASLVRRAREAGPDVALPTWEQHISEAAGEDEVEAFRGMVLGGAPVELPPDVFGPCFRPVRGRHVPFELGFIDPGFAGQPIVLESVDTDGPAARAGLRAGDTIVDLEYRSGDPSVAVTMVVEREGRRLERSYEPHGTPVVGRRWVRDPRIPDEACLP